MFEFKILQSPERAQHGTYEHNGDELIFGSAEGEMIIDDSHLGPSQLKIYFDGGQAYIQNLYLDCEVKLNQNPLQNGPAPLKARDNIAMGRTVFVMSKLKPGPLDPPVLDEADRVKGNEQFKPDSREFAICRAMELSAAPAASSPPPVVPPIPGAPPIPKIPPLPPRK